jgi:thioredoxin-like negative regulator of GroEL
MPTVILFKGGQIVHKFVGVAPKDEFVTELQKVAG